MAQFIPAKDDWANAFREVGKGASEGYMHRTDEKSVRKAIMDLGDKPSARQILDALTNAKTYGTQAKQNAFSNYLGADKLQELKQQHKTAEDNKKLDRDRKNVAALELLQGSELDDEVKGRVSQQLKSGQFDPEGVESLIKEARAEKKPPSPAEVKHKEHQSHVKQGINTINRMRKIGSNGNLGIGSGVLRYLNHNTARDYGEYEQLGKSLIQLSTTIPIRNRQEFETLAENLYNPSIQDAEREGILNAMQQLLEGSLEASMPQEKQAEKSTERKPLSAFKR